MVISPFKVVFRVGRDEFCVFFVQMVPPAVAEQLKSGHQVEPQYFSSATICYIDVVDFMTVAARIQAQHAAYLIRELLRYPSQKQVF